jgi:hypothetical protein
MESRSVERTAEGQQSARMSVKEIQIINIEPPRVIRHRGTARVTDCQLAEARRYVRYFPVVSDLRCGKSRRFGMAVLRSWALMDQSLEPPLFKSLAQLFGATVVYRTIRQVVHGCSGDRRTWILWRFRGTQIRREETSCETRSVESSSERRELSANIRGPIISPGTRESVNFPRLRY